MTLDDLPTPSLILDLARLRRNCERMLTRARAAGVRLRPHVKTHKCVEIARIQCGGAAGPITVSTLAEARAFAAAGFGDMLYAAPIEPGKLIEAAALTRATAAFTVITDDAPVVGALAQAAAAAGTEIGVAIEIDCGYHRSGLAPEAREVAALARAILAAPRLRFAGLLTHAGHAYGARDAAGAAAIARDECRVMRDLASDLAAGGIATPCVSVGSTPTMCSGQALEGVDEIRPGNYALFDVYQAAIGSCALDDCAVSVLAAVTHRSLAGGRATIDAGALALSKDPGPRHVSPDCGYGAILDVSGEALGMRVDGLSQEHGHVHATGERLDRLAVGSRVRVLPNHACLAVAQHAWLHVMEHGNIVDRWATIRGW